MRVLQIDNRSPYQSLIGIGGLGTGLFFALEGDRTLGRNESRPARLLDVRDYCKLHIVTHYVATLLGAHRSGSPFLVLPVGKVGDDQPGQRVLGDMQRVGINTRLVQKVRDKPTLLSVCFQYPSGSGGNVTTTNSAAGEFSENDLDEAAEFLKTSGKSSIALAVPEVPLAVRRQFLELATAVGAFRSASFVDSEVSAARTQDMFEMLDLVALNESEAAVFSGCNFSASAPKVFVETFRSLTEDVYRHLKIIVTVGEHGAYAFERGRSEWCPAPAVAAVSTAGAGDALLGGLLSGLAAGLPLLRAGTVERSRGNGSLTTALDLGVVLASYKVSSPHTIHPEASLDNVLHLAQGTGMSVAPKIRERLVEVPSPSLASLA